MNDEIKKIETEVPKIEFLIINNIDTFLINKLGPTTCIKHAGLIN